MKNVTTAIDEGVRELQTKIKEGVPFLDKFEEAFILNAFRDFAQKIALAALQDAEDALPKEDGSTPYCCPHHQSKKNWNTCLRQSHENIAKLKEGVTD